MGRSSGRVFKKVRKCRISRVKSTEHLNKNIINVPCKSEEQFSKNSPSSSKKKISEGIDSAVYSAKDEFSSGFRLIDLEILAHMINVLCACGNCGSKGLRLYDDNDRIGIVSNIHIFCEVCKYDAQFKTSALHGKTYEANTRLCYAMRCLGVGREGTNLFCGMMNIPPPVARFTDYNRTLLRALEAECKENMKAAVEEAVEVNSEGAEGNGGLKTDLCVSCDGTWMKRGHTSLHGVSSVISVDTGKILDFQVMSKYCSCCDTRKNYDSSEEGRWQEIHKKVCSKNYQGSSGGMEAAGMKLIFQRSVEQYGVRYVKYLGDGDSSAFKTVLESNPYGSQVKIEKLECVGHVQKRMGGRLLRLKKEMKGKKLEDGKPLGGVNRLTDKEIHTLQIYYGKAIRDNVHSVKTMQQAVWAIFFHKLSTDESPQHSLCDISWCKYLQAKASGKPYTHKHGLPLAVLNVIKPTFRYLANPELLKKCVHGKTQNTNESYNHLIWMRCPKTVFVSSNVVKIAACDACLVYNSGNVGRIKCLKRLGFHPGAFTLKILRSIDEARLDKAQAAEENIQKMARQRRQGKKIHQEDKEENEDYGYGEH